MKQDRTIYVGPIFTLCQKQFLINKKWFTRDLLIHKPAVAIILVQNDQVLLVKQMRYGIMQDTLEIPAGLIDEGENPTQAATRELMEEAGLKPVKLDYLFRLNPVPAYCDEVVHFFYCEETTIEKLPSDPDEVIDLLWLPMDEIDQYLQMENPPMDMKTIIALQYLMIKKR